MAGEIISKFDKYRISRMDNIETAYMMVWLVNRNHIFPHVASNGLVLAICWEESCFQNIKQQGGPAVGLGQLEADGLRIARRKLIGVNSYKDEAPFSTGEVLGSLEESMRAVSYCLGGLFDDLHTQEEVLRAYAGVRANPANKDIPAKWKACEAALQPLLAYGVDFNPIQFEAALRKARDFETAGPVYRHIHEKLFPFADVIAQINTQIAIDAIGPVVARVQDTLNRLLQWASGSDFAAPPLVVDGVFGQKTQARVIEFQNDHGLEPDGIVGPLTREAMLAAAPA